MSKYSKTTKNHVQEFSFDEHNRQSVDIRNLVISKQRSKSTQLKLDDESAAQYHPHIIVENLTHTSRGGIQNL